MSKDPTTLTFTVEVKLAYDTALSVLGKCIRPGTTVEVVSADDFQLKGTVVAEITTFPAGICPNCHTDYRGTGITACTNCGEAVPQP